MGDNFLCRNWTKHMDDRIDTFRYFPEPYPYYRDAKKAALVTENGCYFMDLINSEVNYPCVGVVPKIKFEGYVEQHVPVNEQIYCMADAENVKNLWKRFINSMYGCNDLFGYKKIIFNNPATIVLWNDGTKTVVKCQNGEIFDEEKGIALCFMKRALGNKGNFNNVIRKAIQKETKNDA